jgi:hypothetical protein
VAGWSLQGTGFMKTLTFILIAPQINVLYLIINSQLNIYTMQHAYYWVSTLLQFIMIFTLRGIYENTKKK